MPASRSRNSAIGSFPAPPTFTPRSKAQETDGIFSMLFFEPLRVPGAAGSPEEIVEHFRENLEVVQQSIDSLDDRLRKLWQDNLEKVLAIYSGARYNAAVASLDQARQVERVETSAQGQRITVIEAASVPSQPSGPNRKKIALAGIGLGLGLAGGFFVLMELLNNTIRRPAELRSRFQVTPLAVIPFIEGRRERRHRQAVLLAAILAVVIIIPLGLWGLHTQYMPLDILAQKIVTRLGLG